MYKGVGCGGGRGGLRGWAGWVAGVGGVGCGGGWEAEGGPHLPLGHRQWCCVFSKGQIQVQSTVRQRWSSAIVWHHPHPY